MTAPAAQGGPNPGAAPKGRGLKPFVAFKAHWRLAISCFVVVALLGLPVAWSKGKPVYFTEAVLHVAPRYARNLAEDNEFVFHSISQYRFYVHQQVRTITRHDVLLDALENLGDERSLWQDEEEGDRHAAERLAGALRVLPVSETYLLRVGLEHSQAKGLDVIVNAVIDAYLAKHKQEAIPGLGRRVTSLGGRRDELLSELAAASKRRTEIAEEIGVTFFTEQQPSPYEESLGDARKALAEARRARIDAEAHLAALSAAQERESELDLEPLARELTLADAGLNDFRSNLLKRRTELEVRMSGLSDAHAVRRASEREIEKIDKEIAQATAARMKELLFLLESKRQAETATERSRLLAEADQVRRLEEGLETEIARLQKSVSWFTIRYNEAVELVEQSSRVRRQLEQVDGRLDSLILESQAPGFVWLVSAALEPQEPSGGGRKNLFVIFLVLGVVIAGVLPIAIELADKGVHSANDAERLLGFPPLGWLLERGQPDSKHFAASQLRRLALGVDRERRVNGSRRIVLSSVKPGGGTTGLTLDLAQELQTIGIRTLVVEANAFKPDPVYAKDEGPGLTAALSGEAELEDLIRAGSPPFPDLVPVGDTHGQRTLAGLDRLTEFLTRPDSPYELVLIDAPPLLLTPDAELLCATADVALLVVQVKAVSIGEVKRAGRLLERLAPPVVGTIVNRVRVYDGGGYFAELVKEYETGRRVENNSLLQRILRKV